MVPDDSAIPTRSSMGSTAISRTVCGPNLRIGTISVFDWSMDQISMLPSFPPDAIHWSIVPLFGRWIVATEVMSSGWPVRASRPQCRTWALQVDWEYGAIPHEMTPHVSEDADVVVVHSEFVCRSIKAAGRPMPSINVVPHGVDEAMTGLTQPSEQVLQFKGQWPNVGKKPLDLFCLKVMD